MKKNIIFTFVRIFISVFFIYIILKNFNFKETLNIIKSANIFLLSFAYILIFFINILLALRFKYILEIYFKKKLSIFLIWKITMIGLFFNNFLPTSAGGDIVKIFYIVKDQQKKFLSGISILIDRYIGALSVMTMGTISILFYRGDGKIACYLILIFFSLLIFSFYFFSKRKFASFLYSRIKKIIPQFLDKKLLSLYNAINFYFTENKQNLKIAILLSFFLQILSIFSQYIIGLSIIKDNLNILIFFIFIPLIWTSTLIPSLGGLGIREYTYIFLFSDFIGKQNAYALSVLVLITVVLNSLIGGFIFLIFGIRQNQDFKRGMRVGFS
ncbi:MAG: flippase-like domain-containing protein [Candidatus Omnitrophica bacterium]|nr:flippase-like domain-containing protein [Candidatus Omnitrophota bacterium]MCM8801761.1 flippase-like domain-containing protein [Candidatus Omnitrophota bacterium]